MNMLREYNTPENVVRHCIAVADAAVKIAESLNDKGFAFDVPLVLAAGLLHDIARVNDGHWNVGADFVSARGYLQEAEIIRYHMTHTFSTDPAKLRERDMVCLGDRLVLEDGYVGLNERMDYVIRKADGDIRVARIINEKREISRTLIRNIEKIINVSMKELITGEKPMHPAEV